MVNMKGKMLHLLLAFGLVSVISPEGFAQEEVVLIPKPPIMRGGERKTVSCKRTTNSPAIDGRLEDWQIDSFTTDEIIKVSTLLGCRAQIADARGEKVHIKGDKDCSAIVYTMYDDENLYVGAKVTDDVVMNNQSDRKLICVEDALEIWIDAERNASEINNMPYNPGCYQIAISPLTEGKVAPLYNTFRNMNPEPVTKALKVGSSLWEEGYIIEIAIPISALHGFGKQEKGKLIGFSIALMDRDVTDGNWKHILLSGDCEFDATQWGDLVFE